MYNKKCLLTGLFTLMAGFALFAGSKPLKLEMTSPENGARNVAVDSKVVLNFSKNVVNMKVADKNRNCFTLLDAEGQTVDIEIYLPDDQIEPENKRIITLTPRNGLKAGSTYTLVISGGMQAKNGVTLGKEKKITFTTAE